MRCAGGYHLQTPVVPVQCSLVNNAIWEISMDGATHSPTIQEIRTAARARRKNEIRKQEQQFEDNWRNNIKDVLDRAADEDVDAVEVYALTDNDVDEVTKRARILAHLHDTNTLTREHLRGRAHVIARIIEEHRCSVAIRLCPPYNGEGPGRLRLNVTSFVLCAELPEPEESFVLTDDMRT